MYLHLICPGSISSQLQGGFSCSGVAANATEEIKAAFKTALSADGPTVIANGIA